MRLRKALKLYISKDARTTRAAMRDGRRPDSKRNSGAAQNAAKAGGIGFALLQFFIDEIQVLRCRADSSMLLKKAKELRQCLIDDGWDEADLPKLENSAGKMWLRRWRNRYGIRMKTSSMKLKVSWRKILRRCTTHLSNIFRLKAFWELCHPGKPMRWLSADQKPSWFNNAGHTGTYGKKGKNEFGVMENFSATRERYTILTVVRSWEEGP